MNVNSAAHAADDPADKHRVPPPTHTHPGCMRFNRCNFRLPVVLSAGRVCPMRKNSTAETESSV